MMIRKSTLAASLLLATQVGAQVVLPPAADPGAIQQRQIEEERRQQEQERLQRRPATEPIKRDALQPPAAGPASDAIRFVVREVEFTPSEILRKEELEGVARDYRGRQISFSDLRQLAERVNALYRAKGVVTAQALIPPQDVTDGLVRVRLVESRLGSIRLDGNNNTSDGFITWRLGQAPGQLVDLQALERDLVWFNRTTDAQLGAELKPGASFGTTDLQLRLTEPPRHALRLFVDNSGSTSTGMRRHGVSYTNRSVLGWRDDLALAGNWSDGHEGYSVSYGVPFNRWGGRANLGLYKDNTSVRNGPLASLDITGTSRAVILSLRQPVYVGASLQVDLTGGGKARVSENFISGVFLQRTETQDGNLGAELQSSDASGYWLANYAVTSGHAFVAGRTNYTLGRATLRRVHDLGAGMSAHGSLSLQHTGNDLLPSSEQFFIGGEGSVRGYPVGTFSGERGYAVNLELHHPLVARAGDGQPELSSTGFFFVDYGQVKPFRAPNSLQPAHEQLGSVGWGLNATVNKRVSARLTLSHAMNKAPNQSNRNQINLQLVASLF